MSVLVKGQTTTDQFMQISFILVSCVLPEGFYALFPARHTTIVRRAFRANRPSYDGRTTDPRIVLTTISLVSCRFQR